MDTFINRIAKLKGNNVLVPEYLWNDITYIVGAYSGIDPRAREIYNRIRALAKEQQQNEQHNQQPSATVAAASSSGNSHEGGHEGSDRGDSQGTVRSVDEKHSCAYAGDRCKDESCPGRQRSAAPANGARLVADSTLGLPLVFEEHHPKKQKHI